MSGQNALARDLEGWTSTRRFMHGRYGRNHHMSLVRREEGLDERGEAPPPYQPESDPSMTYKLSGTAQDQVQGITMPPRILIRDGVEGTRPPEYRNARQPD